MQTSESITKIAPAIIAAQSSLQSVPKKAFNPHFRSSYADLASIADSIKDTLKANDLAVVQTNRANGTDSLVLVTTLIHSSGEFVSGELEIPLTKKDAQGVGSAMTYGRRYGLSAILGIVTEEDDDGSGASTVEKKEMPKPVEKPQPKSNGNTGTPQTKAQAFATQMVKSGIVDSGEVIQKFLPKGKSKFADLTDAEAEKAYTAMVNYKK